MEKVFYYIGRAYSYMSKRISDWFWHHYLVSFCCTREEIIVADPRSIRFNGKTLFSVSPGSAITFGKGGMINSSHHTISPTLTKIDVGAN